MPANLASCVVMEEADWQEVVTNLFGINGWNVFHVTDSRKDEAGYPDLTVWHRASGQLGFLELKRQPLKDDMSLPDGSRLKRRKVAIKGNQLHCLRSFPRYASAIAVPSDEEFLRQIAIGLLPFFGWARTVRDRIDDPTGWGFNVVQERRRANWVG